MDKEILDKDIIRLTNQLWKIIPMFENKEDWRKQLSTVTLEIAGLNEVLADNDTNYLQLLSKLEGLQIFDELEFDLLRKTIFECISLLNVKRHRD